MTGEANWKTWQACIEESQQLAWLESLAKEGPVRLETPARNILHYAVSAGDLHAVKQITALACKYPDAILLDVNQADEGGNTPLKLALSADRLDLRDALLTVPHLRIERTSASQYMRHMEVVEMPKENFDLLPQLTADLAFPAFPACATVDIDWLAPYLSALKRIQADMSLGGVLSNAMGELFLYVGGTKPVRKIQLGNDPTGHLLVECNKPSDYPELSAKAEALGKTLVQQWTIRLDPRQVAIEARLAMDFCDAMHEAIPSAGHRQCHRAASEALYETIKNSMDSFDDKHRRTMPSCDPHSRTVFYDEHFSTELMWRFMAGVLHERRLLEPTVQESLDSVMKPMFMAASAARISTRHTQWAADVGSRIYGMQHPTGGSHLKVTALGTKGHGGHIFADRQRLKGVLEVLEVASQTAVGHFYGPLCAAVGAAQLITMKTMCAPSEASNMSQAFFQRASTQTEYPNYCKDQMDSRETLRGQAIRNFTLPYVPAQQARNAPLNPRSREISPRRTLPASAEP